MWHFGCTSFTLVNVYVDLVVFTRIASTSKTGSGRYWCIYYIEKHDICLKDYRIRSALSILSFFLYILPDPLSSIIGRCTLYTPGCRMKAYK